MREWVTGTGGDGAWKWLLQAQHFSLLCRPMRLKFRKFCGSSFSRRNPQDFFRERLPETVGNGNTLIVLKLNSDIFLINNPCDMYVLWKVFSGSKLREGIPGEWEDALCRTLNNYLPEIKSNNIFYLSKNYGCFFIIQLLFLLGMCLS